MSLTRYIRLIQQIDQLIRLKATGPPKVFAEKLGISLSRWYEIKKSLIEEHDFPIAYDRYQQTYYYTRSGKFFFEFEKEE